MARATRTPSGSPPRQSSTPKLTPREPTKPPPGMTPTERKERAERKTAPPERWSSSEAGEMSDEDPERNPAGNIRNRQRRDLPRHCPWGGPNRTESQDEDFLHEPERGIDTEVIHGEPWEEGGPAPERHREERRGRPRERREREARSPDRRRSRSRDQQRQVRAQSTSSKGSKGKGKAKDRVIGCGKVDDVQKMDKDTISFHKTLINAVDRRDVRDGQWKNKFLERYALNSITRGYFCNSCFHHIEDVLSLIHI